MSNFYDKWLGFWEESQVEKKRARRVIHEEELQWVKTKQDAKVALIASPETGFRTWGSSTMVAEIPVGWHSGKHSHGEEGIHIVEGSGFSIVNDAKYDWDKGSTLWMPFNSTHQHFNTGNEPVKYWSIMAIHLEHMCGIAKLTQHEECGPNGMLPAQTAVEFDDKGRRIVLRRKDAIVIRGDEDSIKSPAAAKAASESYDEQIERRGKTHHAAVIQFMDPALGFQNKEVSISGILMEGPRQHGGKHAHMEAILYCLQGHGYSIIDGEKIEWKKGSCFHVQGPQTAHQHFNLSDVNSELLRNAFGVRMNFYQQVASEMFPYLWLDSRGDN